MYWRVSASRVARKASRLTLGSVCESGKLWPSSMCPLPLPGSTSTTMSLRLVFGRSSRLALGWISSRYLGSMSMPTTAWPSSRSTEVTLPIWMPATSTAWPWPGRDRLRRRELAGDVVEFFADERHPGRQRGFLLGEDPERHHDPRRAARTTIAIVSLLRPRDWRESEVRKCRQRLTFGSGSWAHHRGAGRADLAEPPVDVGDRVAVAAHVRLLRRPAAELRLGAERRRDRVGVVPLIRAQIAQVGSSVRPAGCRRLAGPAGRVHCRRSSDPSRRSRSACRGTRGSWAGRC